MLNYQRVSLMYAILKHHGEAPESISKRTRKWPETNFAPSASHQWVGGQWLVGRLPHKQLERLQGNSPQWTLARRSHKGRCGSDAKSPREFPATKGRAPQRMHMEWSRRIGWCAVWSEAVPTRSEGTVEWSWADEQSVHFRPNNRNACEMWTPFWSPGCNPEWTLISFNAMLEEPEANLGVLLGVLEDVRSWKCNLISVKNLVLWLHFHPWSTRHCSAVVLRCQVCGWAPIATKNMDLVTVSDQGLDGVPGEVLHTIQLGWKGITRQQHAHLFSWSSSASNPRPQGLADLLTPAIMAVKQSIHHPSTPVLAWGTLPKSASAARRERSSTAPWS